MSVLLYFKTSSLTVFPKRHQIFLINLSLYRLDFHVIIVEVKLGAFKIVVGVLIFTTSDSFYVKVGIICLT